MTVFRLTGYARRRELFAVSLVLAALIALTVWLKAGPYWQSARFGMAAAAVVFVAQIATAVRRLHDIGRSGVWALILCLPIIGQLLTLYLLLAPAAGRKRLGSSGGSTLASVALALFALFGISRIFWEPVQITSEAMKPALEVGDYLILRPLAGDKVLRGDLIAFRHPASAEGAGEAAVGRVIGLAGDQVQMRSGLIWLNGRLLPQVAAGYYEERMGPQGPLRQRPRCKGGPVGDGGLCRKARLTETLPAFDGQAERQLDVLNIETGAFADDTSLFTVPQGRLFVLGDNRDNSLDSRFPVSIGGMGFIPAEDVIGRAAFTLVSAEGDRLWKFWTWRMARVLKGVE